MPKLIHSVHPDIPGAKPLHKNCVLSIIVGLDGKPSDITVLSPASPDFDEKMKKVVESYRFKPATLDGAPVPIEIKVDANFFRFKASVPLQPYSPQLSYPQPATRTRFRLMVR